MVSLNGFNTQTVTAQSTADDLAINTPVSYDADGNVGATATGKEFTGICVAVHDKYASVQLEGYIEVNYSGSNPGVGMVHLVADGAGAVKADSTSTGALRRVVRVDTTNKVIGFLV
jgi:hypothetical protein